ncbi:MAG: ankyrin repeat domain-containing protein, partial [Gammaproteobacteria bacterium]
YGETSLYIAVYKGSSNIVEILIEAKANVNAVTNDGATPLYRSTLNGNIDLVEKLLMAGADVNALVQGNSIFFISRKHPPILQVIVNEKLINMSSKLFQDRIKTQELFIQVRRKASIEQIVDFIIRNKGDINVTDKDGVTLLMIACIMNNYAAVEKLIMNGAKKDVKDVHATALHYAFTVNNVDILNFLLQQNCSLDIQDNNGNYPESWAIHGDKLAGLQVALGLKNNIGTFIVNLDRLNNLLKWAKKYDSRKCMTYLEQVIKAIDEKDSDYFDISTQMEECTASNTRPRFNYS